MAVKKKKKIAKPTKAVQNLDAPLAKRFLWLGVMALAVAGLFAITLVVGRTPQLKDIPVFQDLFSVALVVHVDLSVLIWFLCIAGMGWSILIAKLKQPWAYWQNAAFVLTALATWFIVISPSTGEWDVIKSNYIPVLDNHLFMLALTFLFAALTVSLAQLLVGYARASRRRALSYVELGWLYAGFTTALALLAFAITAHGMPQLLTADDRFETLFWAGGHLLQFTFTALAMSAWLMLLEQLTGKEEKTFWIFIAYAVLAVGAIASFAGFALFGQDAEAFRYHQTKVMIELLGLAPLVMAVIVVPKFLRMKKKGRNAYRSTLCMSLVLFFAGGVLGTLIRGQNVTIPAHYHGEIVGITLALMGVAYAMLPRFGYRSVETTRLAFWQPIVYGIGQLMHVGGLAYSGGYGVLRKTADAGADLPTNIKISMGIMGLGGLLAIIGGLLFVVVMARAWLAQRRATPRTSVLK